MRITYRESEQVSDLLCGLPEHSFLLSCHIYLIYKHRHVFLLHSSVLSSLCFTAAQVQHSPSPKAFDSLPIPFTLRS